MDKKPKTFFKSPLPSVFSKMHHEWGVDFALEEHPRAHVCLAPNPLLPAVSNESKRFTPLSSLRDQITQVRTQVRQLETLEALKAYMEAFDGCALKKTASKMVFGEGVAKPLVMVVGEAPGADEDLQGLPFVGKSGRLLDNILASIGLCRKKNTYIANIIPWRPPGNRPPTAEETALCLPFIERHIEFVQPRVLVLTGAVSLKALLNVDAGMMRYRGQWMEYTTAFTGQKIDTLPTYHPAYLLRSPGQKEKVWQDMLRLQARII